MPVLSKLGATLYSIPIDATKVTPTAIFNPLGSPSGFFVLNIKIMYILFCLEISQKRYII